MTIKAKLRDLFYSTAWRFAPGLHSAVVAQRRPDKPVDPRITYPSFKSLDEHLDLERLKSMDGSLRETVERYLRDEETIEFDTGQLKLKTTGERLPGSRLIELSASKKPFKYHDLDKPDAWELTPAADKFPELMDFIGTLPFQGTARMVIMCDLEGRPVTPHRDHYGYERLHEFFWFRTSLNKPFFVQDWHTKERKYIDSHSAWFDTVNQYHGADAAEGFCMSIRVDGHFTEEFRARIPKPPFNKASTPSLWACIE